MRDRFKAEEIWANMGLPVRECAEWVEHSERMHHFRNILFTRIVPIVKDIGLWGDRVQKAYADMGVLEFATLNPDEAAMADEEIALQFDERRAQVEETIAAGAVD
jgi:hypothetical protein